MISVIIPVYNTEEYLEKCVRSVLAQKGVVRTFAREFKFMDNCPFFWRKNKTLQ